MKVFVTGGTGFTGAARVQRLLKDRHEVSVLENKPGLISSQLKAAGAELHSGSVTDTNQVAEAIKGAEVVVHVAAAWLRKILFPAFASPPARASIQGDNGSSAGLLAR